MEKLTTEQLTQKYGQGSTTPSTGGKFTTDELRKKYQVSSPTTPEVKPESEVKGGFLGNLFTGSTQKFGNTAGAALAAPKNAEQYASVLKDYTDVKNNLMNTIRTKKSRGEDTSRLEEALASHTKAEPKLENFTGDVINKTTGQVLGEAGGTALEALSGGALGSGARTVASKELSLLDKIKSGAQVGATYGSIGGATNALQEGEDVGGTIKGAVAGGLTGGVLGGGVGGVGGLFAKKSNTAINRSVGATEKKASNLTGNILQGTPEDLAVGQKVLTGIDMNGVKNYKDLNRKLTKTVDDLTQLQDVTLETDFRKTKLKDLKGTLAVGDAKLKHNYVEDALDQLEDFYAKTNNQVGQFEIKKLREKASKEGLSVKEINAIARRHGRELSGFNANGELASGLTKQSAENTRKGVKTTLRQIFGNKSSEEIDAKITDVIRVRDLTEDLEKKVNSFKQKLKERGLFEKVSRKLGKGLDFLSGHSLRGLLEGVFTNRNAGNFQMNYGDIEKALEGNLKLLKKLSEKDIPENTIYELLDQFLNQKPATLLDKLRKK